MLGANSAITYSSCEIYLTPHQRLASLIAFLHWSLLKRDSLSHSAQGQTSGSGRRSRWQHRALSQSNIQHSPAPANHTACSTGVGICCASVQLAPGFVLVQGCTGHQRIQGRVLDRQTNPRVGLKGVTGRMP